MSYEDIREMFMNILEFEENALQIYGQILQRKTNAEMRNLLKEIMKDEARHAANAREALSLLE